MLLSVKKKKKNLSIVQLLASLTINKKKIESFSLPLQQTAPDINNYFLSVKNKFFSNFFFFLKRFIAYNANTVKIRFFSRDYHVERCKFFRTKSFQFYDFQHQVLASLSPSPSPSLSPSKKNSQENNFFKILFLFRGVKSGGQTTSFFFIAGEMIKRYLRRENSFAMIKLFSFFLMFFARKAHFMFSENIICYYGNRL